MISHVAKRFTGGLFLLLTAFGQADAEYDPSSASYMLVFDMSYSMRGQHEGDARRKIDVAQDYFSRFVAELRAQDPRANVGLYMFGHRVQAHTGVPGSGARGCADIEKRLSLGALDSEGQSERLQQIVRSTQAVGFTPLTVAVRAALEDLVASTNATPQRPLTLVVFTDGWDECQQDACAPLRDFIVSKQTNRALVAFYPSTLSREQDRKNLAHLMCVNNDRGSEVFIASQKSPEALVSELVRRANRGRVSGVARAHAVDEFAQAVRSATLRLESTRDGKRTTVEEWKEVNLGAKQSREVERGRWILSAFLAGQNLERIIDVMPGDHAEIAFELQASRLGAVLLDGDAPAADPSLPVMWELRREGTGITVRRAGAEFDLRIPPGRYSVSVTAGGIASGSESIELLPGLGERLVFQLDLPR